MQPSSTLYFDNTQTFNNATINLGSTSGGDNLRDGTPHGGSVLTLGSNATIDESGKRGDRRRRHRQSGQHHVVGNQQLFRGLQQFLHQQRHAHRRFERRHAANPGLWGFTNSGTLAVSNGDTVDVETTVTGTGTDTISGASTLEFGSAVSSSTTVGSQNIGITGGGTLDLTDPTSFLAHGPFPVSPRIQAALWPR